MFSTLKHTLSSTVNSVSGFVGAASSAPDPTDHSRNDAAEPARPPRSPTTSRRATATIDLTSPKRQNQASSLGLDQATNLSKSNGRPNSLVDVLPVSGETSRSKATPLPDPRFHFLERNGMPKPGASHAPQPKNTLNQSTYHPSGSVHKTYGHASRSPYLNFLDDDRFSADSRPNKKRRTENEQPSTINVYDEEEIEGGKCEFQTSRPTSRRSAGSGSFPSSGPKDSRSEFERASAISNPRRRKGRTSGHSGFINGDARSVAILVDDDDVPDHDAPRKLQLQKFQQGVEGAKHNASRHRIHETTSKYFVPKMNHSTLPSSDSTQRIARKPNNLRDTFSRGPSFGSSAHDGKPAMPPWPLRWARAHNFKESCEDLYLDSKVLNEYRITSSDRNDTRYEISFKKVVGAQSDSRSRIRLTGSVNAVDNVQYMVDLEFEHTHDLRAFELALAKSITKHALVLRTEDYMRKLFQKLQAGPSTSDNMAPPRNGYDEIQQPSSSPRRQRLLDNLNPENSTKGSQASSNSARVPAQTETQRPLGRPVRTTRTTHSATVDLEDSEDEVEVEKYSQIHGLGTPWKKPLNYGSGRRRAVVDFTDLERLDNGEFLNDQLIDFYLLYLFDQMKVPSDKVYIFNTHFFTTLTRKVPGQKGLINYQGVARWTAKDDIFGYDYIVVPINQDVHWYLAIICNVSNIARTPAIENPTSSDGLGSKTSKVLDSECPTRYEAKTGEPQSIPPPVLADSPPEVSTSRAANEVVDPDDSDLNLVDPRATGPNPSGSSSIAGSPAVETAQMKQLTLSDSKPEGILLSSSSSVSPKKPKRRLGPPPKKWDLSQPVIIVLDSLGGGARSPAVRALKEYILAEGQEKRGMESKISQNAYYAKESQIPQQQNFSDCGVYLLGYAQKFFEGPDIFKNRLLSGEMNVETDWPDMAMPMMRAGMREILQKLSKEQEAGLQQTKKQKKGNKTNGTADATLNPTKHHVEQDRNVIEKAGALTTVVDSKEAESNAEKIITSTSTNFSPQPRLASPFQPQAPYQRHKSQSPSASPSARSDDVPTARGHVASANSGRQASPSSAIPRKCRSPIVLIPSPAKESPKRPHGEIVIEDSSVETTKKRLRTDRESPKGFADGEPRIVGIRSPDPRTGSLSKVHSKVPSLAIPREVSSLAKGSSSDPIPVDDSQETMLPVQRKMKHGSKGPELIITTPKGAKEATLPPTRVHQQNMSSPAKTNIERSSSSRRRDTRSANYSPDMFDDLEVHPQHVHAQSSPAYRHWIGPSRRRAWTSDEDSPEKPIEVPETPPHDT